MSLKSSSPCFLPNVLERVAGIEPASSAWKAEVIASIRHPQILFFLAQNDLLYIRCRFWGWITCPAFLKSLYHLGWIVKRILRFTPSGPRFARPNLLPEICRTGASAWFWILTCHAPTLPRGTPAATAWEGLVEGGGFEPPKAVPTDLQSVPFGRSGTPPTRCVFSTRP